MKKSHHPPPQQTAATTRVTTFSTCFNQSSYLTKCNNVGSSLFFFFTSPILTFSLHPFFRCFIYLLCPSETAGSLVKIRRLLSTNSWTMPKLWPNWPKPSLSSGSIACAWSVVPAPKRSVTTVTTPGPTKRYVGNGRCKRQRRGEDLLGQQRGGKVRNWQRWTLAVF